MSKQLIRSSIVVLLISNMANAFRLVLQIIVARVLTVEAFGIYSSVYSVINIFAYICGAMGSFVTQLLIQQNNNPDGKRYLLIKSQQSCGLICLVLLLTAPLFSFLVTSCLRLDSYGPAVIALGANVLILVLNYYSGVLLAELSFQENAWKDLIVSVFQVLGVLIFVWVLPLSYHGALLALILAHGMGIAYLLRIIKPWHWLKAKVQPAKISLRKNIVMLPPLLGLWGIIGLFLGLDVILARRYLPAEEAGIYSGAALIAKISFFVISSLGGIIFPTVCHNVQEGKSSARDMLIVMGITAAFSFTAALCFSFFPELILTLLYGERFVAGASELAYCSWFMCVFSLNSVLLNYYAAKRQGNALWVGAGGIILSVLIFMGEQQKNGEDIARAFLIGSVATLLILVAKMAMQRFSLRKLLVAS